MVGLRWRKQLKADGGEEWLFECRVDESKNNIVDSTFFWGGQILFFIGWLVLFIINCIGLSYTAVIDAVCMILNGLNLVNYYRCSNGRDQLTDKEFTLYWFIENRAKKKSWWLHQQSIH